MDGGWGWIQNLTRHAIIPKVACFVQNGWTQRGPGILTGNGTRRLGGQSSKYNIGAKIKMSKYIDHKKAFPGTHSNIRKAR